MFLLIIIDVMGDVIDEVFVLYMYGFFECIIIYICKIMFYMYDRKFYILN